MARGSVVGARARVGVAELAAAPEGRCIKVHRAVAHEAARAASATAQHSVDTRAEWHMATHPLPGTWCNIRVEGKKAVVLELVLV